jgi:hypothetical protein
MPNQNPRQPFPAWRLPKGMIKASDEELDKSIESCEGWEWFGGALVIFGVIATVTIAAVHPQYDSFLEQWGSAIADGLVAVGVAIEIKFGQMAGLRQDELRRRSDEKVAEANARAAEANERSARAELETARQGRLNAISVNAGLVTSELLAFAGKFTNREDLSDSARVFLLVSKFEPFAGTQFDAFTTSDGIKVETFLNSLRNALIKAGWIEVIAHKQAGGDHASIHGVRIDVDGSKDSTLLDAANALASALNAEGVATVVNQRPEIETANANVIHILIGPTAE